MLAGLKMRQISSTNSSSGLEAEWEFPCHGDYIGIIPTPIRFMLAIISRTTDPIEILSLS